MNALERLDALAKHMYERKIFDIDKRCKNEVDWILEDWAGRNLFGSGPMIKQCLEAYLRAAAGHLDGLVDSYIEAAANDRLHFSEAAAHVRGKLAEAAAQQKEKVGKQGTDILSRSSPPAAMYPWTTKTIQDRLDEIVKDNTHRIEIEAMRKDHAAATPEPPELADSLRHFVAQHPAQSRCGFVMMRITEGVKPQDDPILKVIKTTCAARGLEALRADEKEYRGNGDLLGNVLTYAHGAGFGILVVQDDDTPNTRLNIALEAGCMLTLRREVCILKGKKVPRMPADLVGKLYREYDEANLDASMSEVLRNWLAEKDIGVTPAKADPK